MLILSAKDKKIVREQTLKEVGKWLSSNQTWDTIEILRKALIQGKMPEES